MVQVSTNGLTKEFSMVNGKITKWKVMVHSLGQMEENM
jgi:hypothetical protein